MIWIYCASLVEHGLTNRLPLAGLAGINRLEARLVQYALNLQKQGVPIKFCAFDYFHFFEVNKDYLQASIKHLEQHNYSKRTLLERILVKGKKIFNNRIRQKLNIIFKHPFKHGDIVIFTSAPNNIVDIEEINIIKKRIGMKYCFFCHDLIPITHPQYFWGKDIVKEYNKKHLEVADIIYSNSYSTENEVRHYLGKSTTGKTFDVSYPGCDIFPVQDDLDLSSSVKKLIKEKYILYVSTIEIRKNHQIIYEAYKKLIQQGVKDLPKVIFVGRKGWKVDELLAQLETDPEIQGKIIMLNHVSDTELHELYQHCLFTVFPSFFEGYGLMVAESLAFGKYCLASATAGPFQEIGGELIDYLDPNDVDAWAEQMAFLFSHPEVLAGKEKNIREKHKNITWEQFAKNLLDPLLTETDGKDV